MFNDGDLVMFKKVALSDHCSVYSVKHSFGDGRVLVVRLERNPFITEIHKFITGGYFGCPNSVEPKDELRLLIYEAIDKYRPGWDLLEKETYIVDENQIELAKSPDVYIGR
jgi:hypothetical protein